jgi:hypothetical protein
VRRYLWDAHLVRAGLSPYAVVPADPAFAHLRTAENWPVNNPDVPSPYPPGAQLFFLTATLLSESVRAIKVAALLCDALLRARLAMVAASRTELVLAYLWSPLVSLEVARHGHLDVVGALLVGFAALALARGRTLIGSIAFALSVALKPLPIVLLPLLWRRVSPRHALAGVAVLLALYLPFWDRHRLPIGSAADVIDRFRFNGPIFSGVASLAGAPVATGFAVTAGLAVAVWARRRLSLASPQAWAWPMSATLLCAPLVYPWYLVWLAPFSQIQTTPLTIWSVSIWHPTSFGGSSACPGRACLGESLLGTGALGAAWLWRGAAIGPDSIPRWRRRRRRAVTIGVQALPAPPRVHPVLDPPALTATFEKKVAAYRRPFR